ncbi:YbbR-like domain-containing protein [Paenibacillus sp. TH7-28]
MDKWLTHNNFAKVLALVVSIILWAMVHLDSGTPVDSTTLAQPKIIDNVNIEVAGLNDEKYVLYDLEPTKVRMEVKGKRIDLTTNFSDYKVKVNLKNVGPGTFTLPLTYELPPGVQLVSIEPSIVKVTIEAKETKTVPVSIVTKGQPADGLLLGSPIVAGRGTVDVTLPSSEIGEFSKVQGTVDVTGLKESVRGKSVKLTAYDKQGKAMENAEISPGSVDVDVPITKMYKTVPIELHYIGQLPAGYVLAGAETDVEGVAVYGTKEALAGISSYPVTVDLGRFDGSDATKYSVDLTPPAGFEKIEPSSVTVTLHVKPAEQKQVDGIPITLENVNSLYNVKVIRPADRQISLTLLGAEDVLGKLAAADIQAAADLADLGPGHHTLPLNVKLPAYVELADASKGLTIDVELTEKDKPATAVPEEDAGKQENQTNPGTSGTEGNPGNQQSENNAERPAGNDSSTNQGDDVGSANNGAAGGA